MSSDRNRCYSGSDAVGLAVEDEAVGESPFRFKKLRTGECYEAGACRKNVLGRYLHLHFAGCPEAAAPFVEACSAWAR